MKLITNTTVKFSRILRETLQESEKLDIAVAYAKQKGIKILNFFNTKPRAQIRLLVGTDFYLSDLEYLEKLKFNYRIFNANPKFHPKIYIFHLRNEPLVEPAVARRANEWKRIVIGSSNLTEGGLHRNIESNLVFSGTGKDPLIGQTLGIFSQLWNQSSRPSPQFLKSYSTKQKKRVRVDRWWK